jgi:hypothetical protein
MTSEALVLRRSVRRGWLGASAAPSSSSQGTSPRNNDPSTCSRCREFNMVREVSAQHG